MRRRDFVRSAAVGAVAASLARGRNAEAQSSAQQHTRPEQSDRLLRACVIGDSDQGGYGHDLHMVWGLRDDIEVVGLADPEESGRLRRAEECGAARAYADYREMLATERPDLVAVAPRWTVHHREYLLACVEAGAHGIVEKPFTVDVAEADAVVEAVRARGLKWTIAFNYRASRRVAEARRLVMEQGLIGEVLEVRCRGKEDHRSGGEDLVVLGVHTFDLMRFFLGKPRWCMADIMADGRRATPADVREATEPIGPIVGDTLHAVFGFEGGIPASFSSKRHESICPERWGLDVYGSRGILTIRLVTDPDVAYIEEPTWAPAGRDSVWQRLPDIPGSAVELSRPSAQYAPIIDDLVAAIREDREPEITLDDARAATEMIQAVFEAPVRGGRVELPLAERGHPLRRWA